MASPSIVDMHVHFAIPGTDGSEAGFISSKMKQRVTYRILLLYVRVPPDQATDKRFFDDAVRVLGEARADRVICLALDAVYDSAGMRQLDQTTMFVPNDLVLKLQHELPEKVLFGASVHPYDPHFVDRVQQVVADGAVLLKWIPSSQQINLADIRVRKALEYLATARAGGPLPLLLHVGMEGEIIPIDTRAISYDFLSWNWRDWIGAHLPGRNWYKPDLKKVHANLEAGLNAGACIIFAHCGLPYFAPSFLSFLEHSDFDVVADYLRRFPGSNGTIRGKAFADVSGCVTPLRATWYDRIRKLPAESLLFGSDFAVPVFELSAGLEEQMEDFKAVLKGDFTRIVIPEDNLLDVSLRELERAFPGHPMFTNAAQILGWTEAVVGNQPPGGR